MAGNAGVARRMESAAALMRQRGLKVGAFAGWRARGRSSDFRPRAIIAHHTAAPVDVDRILLEGRSDLPGPLCNWALHLDGSWWLAASGRANHAGVGTLPSSESYGIECTGPVPTGNTGTDAFPMYQSYLLGVACICEVEGWTARVVYGHKETATPDCRKPDPAFGDICPKPYLDMDRFRASVQARIGQEDEDEMTDADWKRIEGLFDKYMRQGVRFTDHGDNTVPGAGNHLAQVRDDISGLATRLAAIEQQLAAPAT